MDDKLFELMTQIYGEVTKLSKKVSAVELEVSAVNKSQVRIENVIVPKVEAALDGYVQVYEKLLEHDKRFDRLEDKIGKHDMEIRVLKDKAG